MTSYKNIKTSLIEDVEDDDSDSSIEVEEAEEEVNGEGDSDSSINGESIDEEDDDGSGSAEEGGHSEEDPNENTGWADSLAKILKTNKPKGKRSLVLSRAKKISDIKKAKIAEKDAFEVIGDGEIKEEKPEIDGLKLLIPGEEEEDSKDNIKRRENLPNFRVKPTVLEKEREKILSKTATRGVVQLFNAVRNQQKDIERKMSDAGPLERKKDKVMKSLDKTKFLDKLMGQSKSDNVNQSESLKRETKKEAKKEESSTWNVFREDFMMGAKLKDWDKKEKKNEEEEMSSLSDSE